MPTKIKEAHLRWKKNIAFTALSPEIDKGAFQMWFIEAPKKEIKDLLYALLGFRFKSK